ncbi:MAG TPA: hypothetical protein DEO85_00435 [Maritimibacter sp.]|nr:hypothetical protein [Maritimibacter sp.]
MAQNYYENEYGRYSVPDGLDARPAVKKVKSGDVYEPRTIAFMRREVGSGDIVHAGTFFGDFLPALSSSLAEDARIWAFEPNPESFAHATRTIDLNGLSNVSLTNAAVSNGAGELLFRTHNPDGEALGGHSHMVKAPGKGITSVKSVRLDDMIPEDRHVSILQLDVEGHEKKALLGAKGIIERCNPIVILEDFEDVLWLIETFGSERYDRVIQVHGNRAFLPLGRKVQTKTDG